MTAVDAPISSGARFCRARQPGAPRSYRVRQPAGIGLLGASNACERVGIVYVHDGDVREAFFDAVELIDVETDAAAKNPEKKKGGPSRPSGARSALRQ